MIEAVKSTVASSALLRGNVDQSSTLNSFTANPDKLQAVTQAPYISPTVRVDPTTKVAILEFREALTGEVLAQIPSEQALRTYKLREAKEAAEQSAKFAERVHSQNGTVPTTNAPTNTPAQTAQVQVSTAPQPKQPQQEASVPADTSSSTPEVSELSIQAHLSVKA